MPSTTTTRTPAARLLSTWKRSAGVDARRPSISLQLAVVQYCTDVPGTPVPALDDMGAVTALIKSAAPDEIYMHCDGCTDAHPGQLVRMESDGSERALCFSCWNPVRQTCKVLHWINRYGMIQRFNKR